MKTGHLRGTCSFHLSYPYVYELHQAIKHGCPKSLAICDSKRQAWTLKSQACALGQRLHANSSLTSGKMTFSHPGIERLQQQKWCPGSGLKGFTWNALRVAQRSPQNVLLVPRAHSAPFQHALTMGGPTSDLLWLCCWARTQAWAAGSSSSLLPAVEIALTSVCSDLV